MGLQFKLSLFTLDLLSVNIKAPHKMNDTSKVSLLAIFPFNENFKIELRF